MKKLISILVACTMAFSLVACGSASSTSSTGNISSIGDSLVSIDEKPIDISTSTSTSVSVVEEEEQEVIPPNSYRSELTNEWISEDIRNQRPVAVMIDNEVNALPHYGTSKADIVYEMMNSTANGRITRFMCIFKDYTNVERIGNIRSTRSTNCIIFNEYNAILIHDGGPFYINEWLNRGNAKDHISAGFARIDMGKSSTYEEYALNAKYDGEGEYAGNTYASLLERIKAKKFDTEYNQYYPGPHFIFSDKVYSLSDRSDAVKADTVELPYQHNSSKLTYDSASHKYVYSEYNQEYVDALTDEHLKFENVIIQVADFVQFDDHGYMCFYAIGPGNYGYYCTEGYAIPIKWEKASEEALTKYYSVETGEEIVLNTGKTYITICPLDEWKNVVVK